MSRHIALFGGSFNPPHLGHVLCAAYAQAVADLDAVWILPVADHPYGKQLLDWDQRWRLCQLAFAGLAGIELRDDERRNAGGRTVTLVEGLHAAHPDWRFSIIGGTDTERDIAGWYRGAELLAMVDVIAVPRRGYDDAHPAALPAISSTMVRERLARGEAVGDVVPRAVAAAIADGGFYAG